MTVKSTPQDLEIRKEALDQALRAHGGQGIDDDGDYGDLVVGTAAKFEKFLREGQQEEAK